MIEIAGAIFGVLTCVAVCGYWVARGVVRWLGFVLVCFGIAILQAITIGALLVVGSGIKLALGL